MNTSGPVEFFILDGLKEKYILPFVFTAYISILSGNSVIIYLVRTDPKLNTPMYFFLHFLSFNDIVFTSATMPNMLFMLLTGVRTISKTGCLLQMFFFLSSGGTGRGLLTMMAFDRYVAICNPLRYTTIMTRRLCVLSVFGSWVFGIVILLPSFIWATLLPYCGPNVVKHLFCDHSSAVVLACTDTTRNGVLSLTVVVVFLVGTFIFILTSYICICKSVSKMSRADQLKAFGTCVSHLIVVCISYVSAVFVYVSYRVAKFDPDVRIIIAVLYSMLTPLLNPIIYSLRNKELHDAIKRAFGKFTTASKETRKTVPSISK
ncbi:olfactory receptor 6N1-like [Misgurnus anguillicaudatus]|uniref:olfactory receptor 6N1-like n=1 Tax=Misgurnus anguillicaudatus TaxID=75329 RepID=UPI003CCFDC0A